MSWVISEKSAFQKRPDEKVEERSGGIPVTASIGRIFNNNTGCYPQPWHEPHRCSDRRDISHVRDIANAKSSSEPWCHAKGPRSTGCRRFTIADALLLWAFGGSAASGLQKAQGYPWMEFLSNPRKLLIANIAELIFGNFNLTFSVLWSARAGLGSTSGLCSPRPSYSLDEASREPSRAGPPPLSVGLLHASHNGGVSSAPSWFCARGNSFGDLVRPVTLNFSLGYAVAAAWIALFLSGR